MQAYERVPVTSLIGSSRRQLPAMACKLLPDPSILPATEQDAASAQASARRFVAPVAQPLLPARAESLRALTAASSSSLS